MLKQHVERALTYLRIILPRRKYDIIILWLKQNHEANTCFSYITYVRYVSKSRKHNQYQTMIDILQYAFTSLIAYITSPAGF